MSGAHPGGIQPEHSPRAVLCSGSCCGAEPFPVHSLVFFLVTLMLQIFLELFPFSFPDQSNCVNHLDFLRIAASSGRLLGLQNTWQVPVSRTLTYLFSPEIPESESRQCLYCASEGSLGLELPLLPLLTSLCLSGAGVSWGIPPLYTGPGVAPEGQPCKPSLQILSTIISRSFSQFQFLNRLNHQNEN